MGARWLVVATLAMQGACARVPAACEVMCERATAVQEECLAEEDRAWSDLGYEDAADHLDWCHTWAWSQRLLARDAGEPGRASELCEARTEALEQITCEDYDALEW